MQEGLLVKGAWTVIEACKGPERASMRVEGAEKLQC